MKNDQESKVVFMGEEISPKRKEHDSGNIITGMVFIFAGILFLLNTFGILPWEVWQEILNYWPLFLILVGIHLVLGNSLIARLCSVVLSFCGFGLVFLVIIHRHIPYLLQGLSPEIMKFVILFERIKP